MAKPRRYRRRRRAARGAAWILVVLGLTTVAGWQLTKTPWARERARQTVVSQLERRLGREVALREVRLGLPATVEIHGLRVASGAAGLGGDAPFLDLPYGRAVLAPTALLHRRLHLRRVEVDSPRLALRFWPGGSNLPGTDESGERFSLRIDQVSVQHASLSLAQEAVEFSFDAQSLRARFASRPDGRLHGEISAEPVRVRLPADAELPLTVEVDLDIDSAGLTVDRLEFHSVDPNDSAARTGLAVADLDGSATGGCTWQSAASEDGKPTCRFDATGRLDGRLLERLGWLDDLTGPIDLEGTFDWRDDALGWRGGVRAEALTLWDRDLRDLQGQLAADRYGLQITLDRVGHAGGSLQGTVDLRFRGRDTLRADLEYRGLEVDQLADDLGLNLRGSFPSGDVTTASRVARLGTVADGRLVYDCRLIDCARGDAEGEARLRPSPLAAAGLGSTGGLGLTGTVPYRARVGVVTLGPGAASPTETPSAPDRLPIQLRNERQTLRFGGWFDWVRTEGSFDFEVDSGDLGELAPFVPEPPLAARLATSSPPPTRQANGAAADESTRSLWLPQSGRGALSGRLLVLSGAPRIETTLQLRDVATSQQRFDRVAGSLVVDPAGIESLRLDIGDGERTVAVAGRMPFDPNAITELRLDTFDWPLGAARAWLPFELPIDGDATGHLELRLGPEGARGSLAGRLEPVRWGSTRLDRAHARIGWTGDRVQIEQLEISTPAGGAQGGGRVDLSTGQLRLDLRTRALALDQPPLRAWLPQDADGPLFEGRLRATVRVDGTLEQPAVDVQARLLAPRLRGLPLGAPDAVGTLEATVRKAQLDLLAKLPGDVRIEGGGTLAESLDLHFALDAPQLGVYRDLSPFATAHSGSEAHVARSTLDPDALDGLLRGTLTVTGSPTEPVGRVVLSPLELRLGARRMTAAEPVSLRLEGGTVFVDTLRLEEPATGSEVTVAGSASLRSAPDPDPAEPARTDVVDLAVEARLDAAWARRLAPELLPSDSALRGQGRFSGRIGGSLARPAVTGMLSLDGLRADLPGLEEPLEDLRGVVQLDSRGATFEGLSADLGGGRLELDGQIEAPTGRLESYRVQVDGRGVELPDLFGWAIEGDLELVVRGRPVVSSGEASGPPAASAATEATAQTRSTPADSARSSLEHTVVGQVALDRIAFFDDLSLDPARLARAALRGSQQQLESTDDRLASVSLDVQLRGEDALQVVNDLASLQGDVDLALRGTLARPVLFGEVDVDDGGRLIWNDSEYRITRGRLVFADPYRLSPEIDLVATTRVRDFDITLSLAGEPERLETTFSSEPPLPDVEVVRLLAGGESFLEPSGTADVRSLDREEEQGSSAATFLYGQAASVIGERVNDLFGFDKFRIDPLTGSDGDNLSKARLTVGKRLRDDVFVTYSVDPSTTDNQRLQVEWQLTPTLVLVLTQNGDSSFSADARWESSF